jgi:signal-transduction protein with cAMP-binding, CBS, and nucleotidyltransferase domain
MRPERWPDANVGSVLVVNSDETLFGLVTDRDIVTRALVAARGLDTTTLAEMCTEDVATVSPADSVIDALEVMRENAVRRVPVVLGDRPVGIMSLGDVAVRSADSVASELRATLSGISSAAPNDAPTEARPNVSESLRQMWDVPPMAPARKGATP